MSWLEEKRGPIEGSSSELFEALSERVGERRILFYSKSARHFGHQLSRLKDLRGWRERISRDTRRIGGRDRNQRQTVWKISLADIAETSDAKI